MTRKLNDLMRETKGRDEEQIVTALLREMKRRSGRGLNLGVVRQVLHEYIDAIEDRIVELQPLIYNDDTELQQQLCAELRGLFAQVRHDIDVGPLA